MKKFSLSYIPSFEDISVNNNLPIPEMVFILSRNSFSSIKSLEHIENDEYPIFQQDNNISFDLFQQEENQQKQMPINTQESFQTPTKKRKNGCVCKKTECLKLYCQCFANGKICTEECSCFNCHNVEENKKGIMEARNARKNRLRAGQIKCNCRKSNCQKKYCECFNSGVPCGIHCNCKQCHNLEQNSSDEKKQKES